MPSIDSFDIDSLRTEVADRLDWNVNELQATAEIVQVAAAEGDEDPLMATDCVIAAQYLAQAALLVRQAAVLVDRWGLGTV